MKKISNAASACFLASCSSTIELAGREKACLKQPKSSASETGDSTAGEALTLSDVMSEIKGSSAEPVACKARPDGGLACHIPAISSGDELEEEFKRQQTAFCEWLKLHLPVKVKEGDGELNEYLDSIEGIQDFKEDILFYYKNNNLWQLKNCDGEEYFYKDGNAFFNVKTDDELIVTGGYDYRVISSWMTDQKAKWVKRSDIDDTGVGNRQRKSQDGIKKAIQKGINIPPVSVKVKRGGGYQLLDGWHRMTVARELGLEYVPVKIDDEPL